MNRTTLALLVVAAAPCLYPPLYTWLGARGDRPTSGEGRLHVQREASPWGDYDLVRETRTFLLNEHRKLWITTHGEEDRCKWQQIGHEIDGHHRHEWISATELLVTSDGWPPAQEVYTVSQFLGVRIEVRRPAATLSVDSPDGHHRFTTWVFEDSRGKRSSAVVAANYPRTGSLNLYSEGPWVVQGYWVASDDLRVQVQSTHLLPEVPTTWQGIRITVNH